MDGQYSVVRKMACYRLDGPQIESRWWQDFSHLSTLAQGPPPHPPVEWVLGLFPRGKTARVCC
jgi:hypothetical protein